MTVSRHSDTRRDSACDLDNPDVARAHRRLEAMRLGVVPDARDGLRSPGQSRLLGSARRTLELAGNGEGGLQAFVGDYGAGKTHLLECIRAAAMRRGFVTTRAVLDPEECAPSHPRRVYRRLITGLDCPGAREHGLRGLLMRGLRSERVRAQFLVDEDCSPRDALSRGAHLYLTPALRYLDALAHGRIGPRPARHSTDLLLRWLSGDPTCANRDIHRHLRRQVGSHGMLYSLKDYRPWSRIYGYLLSGLARLARLSGYGGLAIFVDEAEFYSLLSAQNRHYALEWFQALAWAARSGEGLPFSRTVLAGGGQGVLKELPPHYADASNLYLAMAFTPASGCLETLDSFVPEAWQRELPPMDDVDYQRLVTHVTDDYTLASPQTTLSQQQRETIGELVESMRRAGPLQTPRDTTRFVVQLLDTARFGCLDREITRLEKRYASNRWGW